MPPATKAVSAARVNWEGRIRLGIPEDLFGECVAQNLKRALGQYSSSDREQTGIDEVEALRVLLEKYEITRAMFRPDTAGAFDYRPALKCASTSLSSSLFRWCGRHRLTSMFAGLVRRREGLGPGAGAA